MRQMLSIYRAGQANRAATNWREIGWLAAAVAAFVAADRWFDIPIFFSAPAAFLSAGHRRHAAAETGSRRSRAGAAAFVGAPTPLHSPQAPMASISPISLFGGKSFPVFCFRIPCSAAWEFAC